MPIEQVNKATVTSATSDVQLTGINTDDIYMLVGTGIEIAVNTAYLQTRVVKDVSGTPTTLSANNYKNAASVFRGNSSFQSYSNNGTPRTELYFGGAQPISNDVSGESANCLFYLHNFNNAYEYSSIIGQDMFIMDSGTQLCGNVGGTQYAVDEAHIGISISGYSTNITSGEFTLYKLT